jgi:hypothetical protein
MAFQNPNTNSSASSNNSGFKQADGFLNIEFMRADGTTMKLGKSGLALHADQNADTAQLVQWLNEDPSRTEKLIGRLVINYRPNKPAPASDLGLNQL